MKPDAPPLAGGKDEPRQAWIRVGAGASLILILLGVLAVLEPSPPMPPGEAAPAEPGAAGGDAGGAEGAATVVSTPREPLIGTAIAVPGDVPEIAAAAVIDEATVPPEESSAPEKIASEDRGSGAMPEAPHDAAATAGSGRGDGSAAADGGRDVAAAAAPVPVAAPAAQGGRLLLQLGVFRIEGNAEALLAQVRKLGVPARLEARVVAGPFADRDALDAAHRQLRQAGLGEGIVVRAR
ncbi:MAG: SPOR domain-containing protein [Rhodocyclaceae bacterium]|nr:SPOR domain-containing protein [Rhodocyclaceae bacterium]